MKRKFCYAKPTKEDWRLFGKLVKPSFINWKTVSSLLEKPGDVLNDLESSIRVLLYFMEFLNRKSIVYSNISPNILEATVVFTPQVKDRFIKGYKSLNVSYDLCIDIHELQNRTEYISYRDKQRRLNKLKGRLYTNNKEALSYIYYYISYHIRTYNKLKGAKL